MRQRTSDDYLKTLKAWYEQHQNDLHDGTLVRPSNGELRNLCLGLVRNGMSKADENVLRTFFGVGQNENLENAIAKFDIEKFRPIVKFLNGESTTKDKTKLNMVAVLVNFPQRPLSVYRGEKSTVAGLLAPTNERNGKTVPISRGDDRPRDKKRILWLMGFGLAAIVVAVIALQDIPAKGCMVWQQDHYVAISCEDPTVEQILKEPVDEGQFRLTKIEVSKKTKFFLDGKPRVWYLKNDNQYEFFNRPGYHPLHKEKTLKPITTHIAMKVVDGEISSR